MIKNIFHGIVVYEILENGQLLNGVYTNTYTPSSPKYEIDNEIARKIVDREQGEQFTKDLMGNYTCRFIETSDPDIVKHCLLTIKKVQEIYEFDWVVKNRSIFSGIGVRVGNNHIAVSYTSYK
jgi:hypothetical protein